MRVLAIAIGALLVVGGGAARATPPAPGQPFDCTGGGDSSCATDDTGCVSDTANHEKCSSAIGKAFAKAIGTVIKCHAKQADARFKGTDAGTADTAEETCEQSGPAGAKTKLDKALAKEASLNICDPTQLTNASVEEAVLFGNSSMSLDGQNVNTYCDSTSGAMLIGGDDTGFVAHTQANLKCEDTVGKNISKLVAAVIKCHDKMNLAFFKGKDFDEESCEGTNAVSHAGARDKFNQARDKLVALNICPTCLDGAHQDVLADSATSQIDAAGSIGYPCFP
jgi:hypothetical protein